MAKKPAKLKLNRGHAFIEDIEYKKPSKNWRPTKRFWNQTYINLETGKTKDKYVVAKDKEQEEKWDKEVVERMIECYKIIWGDKFNWFIENTKYLIDKYGEKEFIRQWREAMNKK